MKTTVLILVALIAGVAWMTHEPVREELSGPIEALAGVGVLVAEASAAAEASAERKAEDE
ncbi:hypothetical protein [Algisphaera agarilytica]|uniref:Uncharacterized protein n=1 Tax=Algisphaera agarilytica TaxID=1385975 RepID=A0A7X0H718_9BACT|nr:hypothetical protein [Algisphaera agarilytica]MBB6430466.1 hypothetical protein [Algisphaera agarilytica]